MTRPTVLDMDMAVTPRKSVPLPYDLQDDFCDDPSCEHGCAEMRQERDEFNRKHNGPDTAWDDVRKYVEGLEEEVGRLEDENSELRYEPWPEWARAVLKVIRSHTGYDGYDDATEGVDMPLELSEHLSQIESDTDRLKSHAEAAEARIAELEKRLADAERVPVGQDADGILRQAIQRAENVCKAEGGYMPALATLVRILADDLADAYPDDTNGGRAARAYMEGK